MSASAYGFAKRQLLRAHDGHSLANEDGVHQRGFRDASHVFNRVWPHEFVRKADEGEHREGVERMAQVVEHVIALAIDDAAFEHRVIESAATHNFLGGPLRFVIGRAALRARAKEADQNNFPGARLERGLHHVARALDVDAVKGLRAHFAIDTGAMCNGVAAGKGLREFVHVVQANSIETRSRQLIQCRVSPIAAASDDHHLMAVFAKRTGNVAPNEPSASGDGDFHGVPPFHATHP